MEKAVYGLAAELDVVDYKTNSKGLTEYSRFDLEHIYYAKNIALTLDHEPKFLITTTQQQENGTLTLVQKGNNLYFKFIPTTEHGERIFRYVKQRKLRQCSFIARFIGWNYDLESQQKIRHWLDGNESLKIKYPVFHEVCLTNQPANNATFCTTDVNHPLLQGIEWETNIIHTDFDYWSEYVKCKSLDNEIKRLIGEIEQSQIKNQKLLKARGIKF